MLAFMGGLLLAVLAASATELIWVAGVVFWAVAVPVQMYYARQLNACLGGVDPVAAFGVKNLSQLRAVCNVPFSLVVLSFLAKTLGWAGLFAIIFSIA